VSSGASRGKELDLKRRFLTRLITGVIVVALGYQLRIPAAFAAGPVAAAGGTNVPGARVYHVTPEQFAEIEPLLKANGFQCLTNTVVTNTVAIIPEGTVPYVTHGGLSQIPLPEPEEASNRTGGTVGGEHRLPSPGSVVERREEAASTESRHSGNTDRTADVVGDLVVDIISSDWTTRDAAVVIFVIIGVAVVVTVIVYAGVYLYEMVTGTGDYGHWWHVQARIETVSGGSSRGQLAGVKLAGGFDRGDTRTGLRLEAGYLNLHIRTEGREQRVRTEGAYLMAGAGLQWLFGDPRNPSSLGLELLAGTADAAGVDILSVARASLDFGIGSHGRFGLSFGTLLVGLDPEEGFVGKHNQFIPILGLETGFRF